MNLVAKEYIACKVEAPESRTGVLILSEFAGAAQEMSQALLVNPHDVRETSAAIGAALSMPEDEKVERAEWMGRRIATSDSAAWARAFLARLASDVERPAALFLDYDGTLRDFVPVPEDAVPDPGLRPLLSKLAAQPGMHVCIVSGRPASFLEEHFKGAGITLVAEHGYRWLRDGADDWELVH